MMLSRMNLDGMTPSQKRAAIAADNLFQQQKAKAQADMINRERERVQERAEIASEAVLQRLVSGEASTWEDATYLIDLYNNQGEEPDDMASSEFEWRLSQQYDSQRRALVAAVEREHRQKVSGIEGDFLRYVSLKDKRDTKKLVASFIGTPFESIVNLIDSKVVKRTKAVTEE